VSITEADVRHVASLARLGLNAERIPSLVRELNDILTHMEVLQQTVVPEHTDGTSGATEMPLRADVVVSGVSDAERAANAPAMRDGFFLVPRLDTHGAAGSRAGVEDADEGGHA
jgi:aspartyl-tRNA(Asn)/glutamyl-tRNA(Gln) amidotransferase subunit C